MTAYVVACYMKPTPPDGNTYTSFKDGNGVQCWLDTRYTHLLQANEPVNRALWFARSRARGRCMSTDRVWKVVYNNKTDKITKWIKKNP